MTPLYVFCGTGDHLWVRDREPVDSPAAIAAMLEWMAKTYGVRRLYWRGGQSRMWDEYFRFGPESVPQYDWTMWKRHLYRDLKINEAAAAEAKRRGMEIFLYSGLFEFGIPPDIGIVGPYLFEDRLAIEHPEWRPLDRWGERRCPGPMCYAYPEVRREEVRRYVEHVERFGYDGVNFYTYVENGAIRYPDEFGWNKPILDEMKKKHPGLDVRKSALTEEQLRYWARIRGRYVTELLRELHAALAARGKKLSMILDAKEPDYAQPWWSQPIAGTGLVEMDWRTWLRERIVDEIWVQLAPAAAQRAALDKLLKPCRRAGVKLTVRAVDPFDPGWRPYVDAGVTPVAVITWARNGIERYTLEPTSAETLGSADWRLRLQTVADVETGRLKARLERVAALAKDPNVLVRRRVMYALAARRAEKFVNVLEAGLKDEESCVRIAAAAGLAKIHGPDSAVRLFAALGKDGGFQFKAACVDALAAMGDAGRAACLRVAKGGGAAAREVAVRALYKLSRKGRPAFAALFAAAADEREDDRVRYYAIEGLVGLRGRLSAGQREKLAALLMRLIARGESPTVRLRAGWGLGYLHGLLRGAQRGRARDALAAAFEGYGDGSRLPDAAYGWRVFGNALWRCGAPGRRRLERMRAQRRDKWLAWLAYEVLYAPYRTCKVAPADPRRAIEEHLRFAPEFPGYRRW